MLNSHRSNIISREAVNLSGFPIYSVILSNTIKVSINKISLTTNCDDQALLDNSGSSGDLGYQVPAFTYASPSILV